MWGRSIEFGCCCDLGDLHVLGMGSRGRCICVGVLNRRIQILERAKAVGDGSTRVGGGRGVLRDSRRRVLFGGVPGSYASSLGRWWGVVLSFPLDQPPREGGLRTRGGIGEWGRGHVRGCFPDRADRDGIAVVLGIHDAWHRRLGCVAELGGGMHLRHLGRALKSRAHHWIWPHQRQLVVFVELLGRGGGRAGTGRLGRKGGGHSK